jgi:hypothetical protein
VAEQETTNVQIWVRVSLGLFGFGLLALGIWATFDTRNGTGAAALITVGAVLGVGAVIWDHISEINIAGTGLTRNQRSRLDFARALDEVGAAEDAQEVRQKVVEEVAPEAAVTLREYRESLQRAVSEAIQNLGLRPIVQLRSVRKKQPPPDYLFTTPTGKNIAIDILVATESTSGRQGSQRRLEAAAREAEYDGFLLVAGSPNPSVMTYLAGALSQRLDEWLSTGRPRLALAYQAVDDESTMQDDIRRALQSLIDRVDQ